MYTHTHAHTHTHTHTHIYIYIYTHTYCSPNAKVPQLKNCPFRVENTIELKNVAVTSNNTGTLLSQSTPWQLSLLSDVFQLNRVLTPNRHFLDSATIAFGE